MDPTAPLPVPPNMPTPRTRMRRNVRADLQVGEYEQKQSKRIVQEALQVLEYPDSTVSLFIRKRSLAPKKLKGSFHVNILMDFDCISYLQYADQFTALRILTFVTLEHPSSRYGQADKHFRGRRNFSHHHIPFVLTKTATRPTGSPSSSSYVSSSIVWRLSPAVSDPPCTYVLHWTVPLFFPYVHQHPSRALILMTVSVFTSPQQGHAKDMPCSCVCPWRRQPLYFCHLRAAGESDLVAYGVLDHHHLHY